MEEDAGRADDEDAGVVDAGPVYDGPPYEVEDGFFDDDALARAPWRCDAPPYRWWGTTALGDVLEHEEKNTFTEALLTSFKTQLSSSIVLSREPASDVTLHRVRYQTQDRGALTDATMLVAVPRVSDGVERPVLLYMHGTEGFVDACSPSSGIDSFFDPHYVAAATLAMFASWGFVVVAPDYLGLKSMGPQSPELHPYLIAEPTALASLDAVRAAGKLLPTLDEAPVPGPLVVMGVSQGGHGAAFVVRYQPHYAVDLPIAGAVYAVPPLDLVGESEFAAAGGSSTVRGSSGAFLATGHLWYRSEVPITDAVLPPHDVTLFDQLYTVCNVPTLSPPVDELFSTSLRDGALEPFACMGRENSLVHTSVERRDDTPGLVILAENDELVSREAERQAFVTLCDADDDVPLELIECAASGHVEGFTYAIDDAFAWLDARLRGDPLTARCEPMPPAKCASDPR